MPWKRRVRSHGRHPASCIVHLLDPDEATDYFVSLHRKDSRLNQYKRYSSDAFYCCCAIIKPVQHHGFKSSGRRPCRHESSVAAQFTINRQKREKAATDCERGRVGLKTVQSRSIGAATTPRTYADKMITCATLLTHCDAKCTQPASVVMRGV